MQQVEHTSAPLIYNLLTSPIARTTHARAPLPLHRCTAPSCLMSCCVASGAPNQRPTRSDGTVHCPLHIGVLSICRDQHSMQNPNHMAHGIQGDARLLSVASITSSVWSPFFDDKEYKSRRLIYLSTDESYIMVDGGLCRVASLRCQSSRIARKNKSYPLNL